MRSWDRAKPNTSWPSPRTLAKGASVPDRPWRNVGKTGRCNATITTDVISPNLQLLGLAEMGRIVSTAMLVAAALKINLSFKLRLSLVDKLT